jgi:hypothetical protein
VLRYFPFLALLAFIFGADPTEVLLSRLSRGALPQPVTIQYFTPNHYLVWTPVDGGLYWAQWGVHQNESGFWAVRDASVYRALDAVDDVNSEIRYTGTWDALSGGELTTNLGRSEHRSGDPTASLEFDVTGIKTLYIAITQRPEGGYGRISIDGGKTLANGSGVKRVPGGDRVIDFYAQETASNQWVEVAKNLDPGRTYVVQITPLGSGQPGSTGGGVYFDGYGSPCAQLSEANKTVANDTVQVLNVGLNMGYAYRFEPEGVNAFLLSGSDHNNEAIERVTIQAGSRAAIKIDQQNPILTSPSIRFVQSGWARHPDTGPTNQAKVSMSLEFTPAGVKQTTTHQWISRATINTGYTGMMAGTSDMNRGYIAGGDQIYNLGGDDEIEFGHLRSRMAILFGTSHDFVLGGYIPDLVGVNEWQDSRRYLFIDDKAGGTNKIYFEGIGTPVSVNPGDVWTSDVRFAIFYKPDFFPIGRPER